MNKYRIVYKDKWSAPYHVERRILFFFWVYDDMFSSKELALEYIAKWTQKGVVL